MANAEAELQVASSNATWSMPGPISWFSAGHYTTKSGKHVQLPVSVAGDRITVAEYPETARPQS